MDKTTGAIERSFQFKNIRQQWKKKDEEESGMKTTSEFVYNC